MFRTYGIIVAIMALIKWDGIMTQEQQRSCSHFEFHCKNSKKCISMERLCNGIVDCEDNSDELPDCTRT